MRRRGSATEPGGSHPKFPGQALVMAALTIGCLACNAPSAGGSSHTANASAANVPSPTVEGPILPASGISFLGSTLFPLSQVGYEEEEYFISGTATSYTSTHKLTSNGRWHVDPAHHAAYTTRVIVYRPIDPSRFDGTVEVEWLNVTGGVDAAAAWLTGHPQMIRDGMVYVGVDAQEGGIYGEKGSIASADGAGGIKQTDPARYGALVHPGDSFSYSIFEQMGEAVHTSAARLLGGLAPKRVIAIGESQSAFRLVTYIDAIQPLSPGVYDGYLVYSRGGDGADLSQSPQATIATPTPTYIRTDVGVPVLLFETEADLITLGYEAARQPPTKDIREWEIAGTAHDDTYGLLYSRSDNDNGVADIEAFESMLDPPKDPIPGIVDCGAPINAAFTHLRGSSRHRHTESVGSQRRPGTAVTETEAGTGRKEVPLGRQWQRTRRRTHSSSGGARRQAVGHWTAQQHFTRSGRNAAVAIGRLGGPLQYLRHHCAVQRRQGCLAVPDPRGIREEVGRCGGVRGASGVSDGGGRPDTRQDRRRVTSGRLNAAKG